MPGTILYADTDRTATALATKLLTEAGHHLLHAQSAEALERELASGLVDVLVVDLALPGLDGLTWVAAASRRWPDLPLVLVVSGGTEEGSVEALRAGASGIVAKPFDSTELLLAVQKGVTSAEASADEPPASSVCSPSQQPTGTLMVGDCPAVLQVQQLIRRAANSNATVLVRGESGSGKEVIARQVHELGSRSHGPFIKVHCAALPEALLESELFGHEKGAFTGATSRKPGRLEIAEGGTLFLDEIGDITAATQVKLLRVLQDKQYERVGGTRTIKADVRFIAATHRPLEEMIKRGEFREDLYYRLNVIPIVAPALRARPDDIEQLVRHFCAIFGAQSNRPNIRVAPDAIALLRMQDWPGNVRQLQNFVERLVVFAEADEIGFQAIKAELGSVSGVVPTGASGPVELNFAISVLELDEVVKRAERKALEKALHKAGGNRTVAARILGVSRRTLYNKLEEHGLV